MSREYAVLLIYITLHSVGFIDVPEWGDWCPRKMRDETRLATAFPPGGFTRWREETRRV